MYNKMLFTPYFIMNLMDGFIEALNLLLNFNPELYQIIFLSIYVSAVSAIISALIGFPIGALIAIVKFPGRQIMKDISYTLMGLPSVVAGLIIFLLLSRNGPLGGLGLLYTPSAMIIAQTFLGIPIVVSITISEVSAVTKDIWETAISLGATRRQASLKVLQEAKSGLITAFLTTFSMLISEVGAVMMVGGNILFKTRTLTTATVLSASMGDFGFAIALGLILLFIAFVVNVPILRLQRRKGTIGGNLHE
jgi:tungstate transport system permease protein